MEVLALVISGMAFVLSLWQFLRDSSRQKKEATLNAYKELQNDVLTHLSKYDLPMPEFEYQGDDWKTMTVYLAKLEQFSVGINTGIYSIDVLNHLGGAYYIRQFKKLKPIIDRKRKENISAGKHYDEFEKTVSKLVKYRETKNVLKRFWYRMF